MVIHQYPHKYEKNERPKIDFDIVIRFAIKNYIEVNISYPSNHYCKSSPPNLTGSWRKLDGSFLIPMQKSDPLQPKAKINVFYQKCSQL